MFKTTFKKSSRFEAFFFAKGSVSRARSVAHKKSVWAVGSLPNLGKKITSEARPNDRFQQKARDENMELTRTYHEPCHITSWDAIVGFVSLKHSCLSLSYQPLVTAQIKMAKKNNQCQMVCFFELSILHHPSS